MPPSYPLALKLFYHCPVLKEKEWPLLEGVVKKAACSRTSLRIEHPLASIPARQNKSVGERRM